MANHEHSWEVTSITKGLLLGSDEMLVRCTQCGATTGAELEETSATTEDWPGSTITHSGITIWGWAESSDPEINNLQRRADENPARERHMDGLCNAYRKAKRQS